MRRISLLAGPNCRPRLSELTFSVGIHLEDIRHPADRRLALMTDNAGHRTDVHTRATPGTTSPPYRTIKGIQMLK